MRKIPRAIFVFSSLLLSVSAFAAPDFAVFEARTKNRAPTLVFVHGGAWVGGDKADYAPFAEAFLKEGICVVTVNYDLAPRFQHPRPVEDLAEVLKALHAKKSTACDFGRLTLSGHSAGAHLIAYWAATHEDPAVKGLIGIEGIYDLPALAKRWPTYPDWFLKKEFGDEGRWADASPTRRTLRTKAPWLIVHSKADELVDLGQAESFAAALKKQGIPVELVTPEAGTHDGTLRELGRAGSDLFRRVVSLVKMGL